MIKIVFQYNREAMIFVVKQREIYYTDRKFKVFIRCLPPAEGIKKMVLSSRNTIPGYILNLFQFNDEEMKEYESCKTEDDLANIIIKDATGKGCILVGKNEVSGEDLGGKL